MKPIRNGSSTGRASASIILLVTLFVSTSCSTDPRPEANPVAKGPLPDYLKPLEDEPPLLLGDDILPWGDSSDDASTADNSRCFVCHLNYATDELAVTHAQTGFGCAYCHRESSEHIADESWTSGGTGTAPDRIFRPEQVKPFCLRCHELGSLSREVHTSVASQDSTEGRCTLCHGDHLLENRITNWK